MTTSHQRFEEPARDSLCSLCPRDDCGVKCSNRATRAGPLSATDKSPLHTALFMQHAQEINCCSSLINHWDLGLLPQCILTQWLSKCVPGPETAWFGNLLKLHILDSHSKPTESETLGMGSRHILIFRWC